MRHSQCYGFLTGLLAWAALQTCHGSQSLESVLCSPPPKGTETPSADTPIINARLSRALSPLHYTLFLQPHLQPPWLLEGQLLLQMVVLEATDTVELNMMDIVTLNDTLKVVEILPDETVRDVPVLRQEFDQRRQMYTVVLSDALSPGSFCNMSLNYQGLLNDKLVGFYRSQYNTPQGETRWLASTQFSPTDARRAFPCFDEPAFKSTFDVTIVHSPDLVAHSNMPLEGTSTRPNGLMTSSFATTPVMSTFIVAFHVSDFQSLPVKALKSTNFTVWSRPEVLQQATYAYTVAPAMLEFLEDYFNSSFPLPKLDMVAVPDFKFSGMENWGLIAYRETAMLLEEKDFSPHQLFRLAYVIAHEISHQWFGNLVTPSWWSELWLKEGFASFIGYLALDAVEKDWSVMEKFVNEYQQSVMPLDSFQTSHPINQPVNHPDQIGEIFDQISYEKGASLLRMLYNFVGPRAFQEGLTNYLDQLQYSTANQDDLWRHLSVTGAASLPEGVSVKTIMDTWTYQKGYPVVNVTRTNESITLSQEQLLLDGSRSEQGWWVPVTFTTATSPSFDGDLPTHWMKNDPAQLLVIDIATHPDEWVAVNLNAGGFFRVNYSPGDWELLSQLLQRRHRTVPPAHRAALIDDAFSLARAGRLNYSVPLALTQYLRDEVHHVPWKAALSGFDYFYRPFQHDKAYGMLKDYLLWLVTPWYEHLGFEDTPSASYLERSGREIVVSWACRLQHPGCVAKAQNQFDEWISPSQHLNGTVSLPGLVRYTVLCGGVADGGEERWEALWQRYLNTTEPSLKQDIVSALGCTKEVWLLARYLDMAFTADSGVRKQDARTAFSAVVRNPAGHGLAWRYLRTRWRDIVAYLGSNNRSLAQLLLDVTKAFNSDFAIGELEVFEREQSEHLGAAERGLQQAKEAAGLSVSWWRNHYETVTSWLTDHNDKVAQGAR